jgi:hypothetical protein
VPGRAGRLGDRIRVLPPLVGPLTLKIGDEETYWHAGDGGLYENQGLESLILLYLKQLQLKRTKKALLILFESSFPFSVGERRLLRRSVPFSLLTFDFSRIPSIMEERATTYQTLFFWSLQTDGVFPDSKTIAVINLRHTDAKWAADMSNLPPACKAEATPLATPEEVTERIAEIPTRLVLTSECDRQLPPRPPSWSTRIAPRSSSFWIALRGRAPKAFVYTPGNIQPTAARQGRRSRRPGRRQSIDRRRVCPSWSSAPPDSSAPGSSAS